jgi:hypothetical protein
MLRIVLRGAFSQVTIGLAIGLPAAIVQRKTLGPGVTGLGHVGFRPCGVACVGDARVALPGVEPRVAAERMRDRCAVLWGCVDVRSKLVVEISRQN